MQATDCAGDAATTPRNTLRQVVSVVAGVSLPTALKWTKKEKEDAKKAKARCLSGIYVCTRV